MRKNYNGIKNKILNVLSEVGYSQKNSGINLKSVMKPIRSNELTFVAENNLVLLEKLLEDMVDEKFIEEIKGNDESRYWEITTQGLHFYNNEDGYSINNSEYSEKESQDIIRMLDELAIKLSKLELGHEIIYEDIKSELDDLKSMISKLDKKSFGQLLKGKLIELGFGDIINEASKIMIEVLKSSNLLNE